MKKQIWSIALAVFAALFVWRYLAVNRQYPPPAIEVYSMNEPMIHNGFEITATDIKWYDKQFLQQYQDEIFPGAPQKNEKELSVTLSIKNIGDKSARLNTVFYELESFAWRTGIDGDLLNYIEGGEENPELEPGESTQLELPFRMVSSGFSDERWNALETEDFQLLIAIYPVKKVFQLSD